MSEAGPNHALEGRDLRRRFDKVDAVDGLSFHVEPGELYGLIGPDGAGKTTTIRLLTGLLKADGGESFVMGEPVAKGGLAVREAVGYMPQQYSLYGDLSVDENLRFFGQLFGIRRQVFNERRDRLLGLTRLARFGDRRADALSGGMYKKLALACALLHRPRVLILDEPTNGVDPVSRRELWDLLYEFVAEGMAVLLATPYMDEAARCHRVGLVHAGRLLAEGEPKALTAELPHRAYLIRTEDRDGAEALLDEQEDVVALSPQGASLRAVVRAGREEHFARWASAAEPAMALETVPPDFEDVFLALLASSEENAAEAAAEEKEAAA